MATPMVAGVAALVWGANPTLTNAQIRDLVQNTADTVGALGQNFLSWTQFGRVNLYAALNGASGGVGGGGGGDTTAPEITAVTSAKLKGTRFEITWATNELSTSTIVIDGDLSGTYTDNTLTTNHRMTFRGSKGTMYTYDVKSKDAAGNEGMVLNKTHQN